MAKTVTAPTLELSKWVEGRTEHLSNVLKSLCLCAYFLLTPSVYSSKLLLRPIINFKSQQFSPTEKYIYKLYSCVFWSVDNGNQICYHLEELKWWFKLTKNLAIILSFRKLNPKYITVCRLLVLDWFSTRKVPSQE